MSDLVLLLISPVLALILTETPIVYYLPQILALLTIVQIILFTKQKKLYLPILSLMILLTIFRSEAVNSPFFFLIYFLIFFIAFSSPPIVSASFSIITIAVLFLYVNSPLSLIPLAGLIFTSPLSYFVSQQLLLNIKNPPSSDKNLANTERDIFIWSSLILKPALISTIDSVSLLLSSPQNSPSQKDYLQKIRQASLSLLKSSKKLTKTIDIRTDDK